MLDAFFCLLPLDSWSELERHIFICSPVISHIWFSYASTSPILALATNILIYDKNIYVFISCVCHVPANKITGMFSSWKGNRWEMVVTRKIAPSVKDKNCNEKHWVQVSFLPLWCLLNLKLYSLVSAYKTCPNVSVSKGI